MATITAYNSPVFNEYWNVIKNWSNEWKDALVTKLTESRSTKKDTVSEKNIKSWDGIFGSMKDDKVYPSVIELKKVMEDHDKDYSKFSL